MLEAKLAEIQSKAGRAEDKWEARVREYENRLRVAGEKIKTEKQGGKERALQLEGQVRWVPFPLYVTPFHICFGSHNSTSNTHDPRSISFLSWLSFLRAVLTNRELERQVDSARRRNTKAEGIVATASHLMPSN